MCLWFTFVAQIFIGQFFNYRGALGWLNQPLVHLPWIHDLPDRLRNQWGEFAAVALLILVAWRARRFVGRWRFTGSPRSEKSQMP